MSAQFTLLQERRFLPFFLTQFLGAFNDNFYKNALVVLITFQAAQLTDVAPGVLVNIAAGLFILPFFLFSATAGQLADKVEKSRLIRLAKLLEVIVMLAASLGFALSSLPWLLATLFLMGAQSALFGPVKYAILPQILAEHELVGGNALVEAGTFVAILLGTIVGGLLIAVPDGTAWVSAGVVAVAALGYLASRAIRPVPAADPQMRIAWNPLAQTWQMLRFARERRTVFLAIVGISWFWFYGAVFLSQFPGYAATVLGGDEQAVTLLLAVFSVGIAVGSLLCERLSGKRVEIGLVPLGSIGLTVFGIDLWWASPVQEAGATMRPLSELLAQPGTWRILFDLVMIALCGGLYIVPLYALVQSRSAPAHRSRIIAANNILNAAFMVAAAALGAGLLAAGFGVAQIFLITALLNAAVAFWLYTLVPAFLLRFIVWLLVRTAYRLKVEGLAHLPEKGPALIVANGVSGIDALIVLAACRRPVRWAIDQGTMRGPFLSCVFRASRAIPLPSVTEEAAAAARAFDELARALTAGELVGLFLEGRIADTGESQPLPPDIERIVRRSPVPVVPMALGRARGGFCSRRWRLGFFTRIRLVIGAPLPPQAVTARGVQQQVAALGGARR
ncbi:MFS transporter [Pseudothauera hydrothermalis]|uniref:MFS transporter n=1 Tax=Pseudothauera hydrothermalis TaxID=2184083 RepID=UPI000C7B4721|nr:MFS transporter [Pseudothauera hydrothermalis]AUM01188.1 glycerol acyltransferase [Rhodocyclaceae bacterium]